MDSSTLNPDQSISNISFYFYCFIEIPVINANSVDPDQMLHSAASDVGLHFLPVTLSRVSRLKWVRMIFLCDSSENLQCKILYKKKIKKK